MILAKSKIVLLYKVLFITKTLHNLSAVKFKKTCSLGTYFSNGVYLL